MRELMDLLTNSFVSTWIAPVITGILASLAAGIITVQRKKDNKRIKDANEKYIQNVRQFIVQNIEISLFTIQDLRKAIVKEFNIKEKYILTEENLRNKIIYDISESKYINEKDKKDLIDYTYKTFKNVELLTQERIIEKENSKRVGLVVSFIILISSIVFTGAMIGELYRPDTSERFIIISDTSAVIISLISIVIGFLSLRRILKSTSVNEKILDIFFEPEDEDHCSKQ